MRYAKGCGCAAADFAPLLAVFLYFGVEPGIAVERLFQGDTRVKVTAITIRGQDRTFELKDAESVQYLTAALRKADRNWQRPVSESGPSYEMLLHFGGLQYGKVHLDAGTDEDGVRAGYGDGFGDLLNHWIAFPQPIPAPVAELLRRLRTP